MEERKSPDFLIGPAFFIHKKAEDLAEIFNYHIIPLLYEYFPNRPERIKTILEKIGLAFYEENYQIKVQNLNRNS